MTNMSKALSTSGIRVPTKNRRIWGWLKDHGEHTGSEVAAGLNISAASASSLISQMVDRRMLKVDKKFSTPLNRFVGYYSIVGKEFVTLPVNKKKKIKEVGAIELVPEIIQELTVKLTVDKILDSLTITQASELYEKLDLIFNRKR